MSIADDQSPSPQRIAEYIARAERAVFVTAHRADTARIERLEERQQLLVQPIGPADVSFQHQHEVAIHRIEPRVQVLYFVVRDIAERQTCLEYDALQAPLRRIEDVGAGVT